MITVVTSQESLDLRGKVEAGNVISILAEPFNAAQCQCQFYLSGNLVTIYNWGHRNGDRREC